MVPAVRNKNPFSWRRQETLKKKKGCTVGPVWATSLMSKGRKKPARVDLWMRPKGQLVRGRGPLMGHVGSLGSSVGPLFASKPHKKAWPQS
jgi:hypothetical protein